MLAGASVIFCSKPAAVTTISRLDADWSSASSARTDGAMARARADRLTMAIDRGDRGQFNLFIAPPLILRVSRISTWEGPLRRAAPGVNSQGRLGEREKYFVTRRPSRAGAARRHGG